MEPKEAEPTVAELAGKIKALRAGNAVEASVDPDRKAADIRRAAGDGAGFMRKD